MNISLQQASLKDLHTITQLAQAYQAFEGFESTESDRISAIETLLSSPALGRIYLIQKQEITVGYIALCLGYSLEFCGLDAFIDEFYIEPQHRGLGIGHQALELIKENARDLQVQAVHLEVAQNNQRAHTLYRKQGFASRQKYTLMTCVLS